MLGWKGLQSVWPLGGPCMSTCLESCTLLGNASREFGRPRSVRHYSEVQINSDQRHNVWRSSGITGEDKIKKDKRYQNICHPARES